MKYNHFNLFYIKIDVSIINGLKEANRATPICQADNTSNNQKVEHTICLFLAGLPLTKPHSVAISSPHQTCLACFSGLTSEVRLHGAEASAQESQLIRHQQYTKSIGFVDVQTPNMVSCPSLFGNLKSVILTQLSEIQIFGFGIHGDPNILNPANHGFV